MEVSDLLNALHIAEKLKNTTRHSYTSGGRHESALNFYKRAGYNCEDKTAFIQWL